MLSFHINLFNQRNGGGVVHSSHGGGGLFFVGAMSAFFSNASYALWLAKMRRSCLYPYSSTALMSVMATLLSVTFTFCVERDFSQWKLDWNVRLLIVAYAGIVVSEVMVAMISWCIRMRGLLFVSVFSPLMLVVVAFARSTILHEKLYLGRAALPQNLHMEALALTSEIFVATISYLIPAITFILSLSFSGKAAGKARTI
ncbi:hypothetical protein Ahy_A04g017409 isoform A [Arachis hypogaea]|uniref:Uncharacterized protein n=1 Tax=Arachis hypogaea TaxID=3818 RepID=A0A445DAY5_ARAHY|nr:hypothetical protein Ahy_A04g017409 isoform A [Arachis hypogaea]